ncbi:MAG: tetratricopeptide repeat protein, partial [Planctomycetota bacterium]
MTEKNSNDGDLLHRSGVSAYQNGDLKKALELVFKAIEINSNVPEYYNTFGVILAQAGREQGAIKAY